MTHNIIHRGFYVPVIKDAYLPVLKSYKNRGEDRSLTRRFILNYFYEFLVNYIIPPTVHPNVVTLFGFSFLILSTLVCAYYSPNFSNQNVPNWVFLLNAVCIFTYQTMDNCDGKQARKTGSSSPLGDLCDHGCDSLGLIFGCIMWMTLIGQGPTLSTFLVYLYTTIPFVIETWEEYYVGGLFLPEINGPVEGLLALATCQLIAFFYGQQIYFKSFAQFLGIAFGSGAQSFALNKLPHFISNAELWVVCTNTLLLFSILTMFLSLFLVHRAVSKQKSTLFQALPPLLPFIIALSTGALWINTTPIFKDHPYLFLFTIAIAIAYFCNRVTLAFILNVPISETIKNPMVITFALLFLNVLAGYFTNRKVMVPDSISIYITFVTVLGLYMNYVVAIALQISHYLNINIFTLSNTNKKA